MGGRTEWVMGLGSHVAGILLRRGCLACSVCTRVCFQLVGILLSACCVHALRLQFTLGLCACSTCTCIVERMINSEVLAVGESGKGAHCTVLILFLQLSVISK